MRVFEYKLVATKQQEQRITEAIRTVQFIRNKALRLWMDKGVKQPEVSAEGRETSEARAAASLAQEERLQQSP